MNATWVTPSACWWGIESNWSHVITIPIMWQSHVEINTILSFACFPCRNQICFVVPNFELLSLLEVVASQLAPAWTKWYQLLRSERNFADFLTECFRETFITMTEGFSWNVCKVLFDLKVGIRELTFLFSALLDLFRGHNKYCLHLTVVSKRLHKMSFLL